MPKAVKKGVAAKPPVKTAPDSLTPAPAGVPMGLNSADVTGNGKSVEEIVRKSNFWRDSYNPLRGLTMPVLTALFEASERGAFAEIQLVLRKAEKRFPILRGFLEKLLSSVEALEWDVRVMDPLPDDATAELAEKQRKWLRSRYGLLKNFQQAIGELVLADVRGYAVLQKHRYYGGANDGAVEELYWIEPWCWSRDGYYGDFYYNEISRFGVGLGSCKNILGENNRVGSAALPRSDFVVREVNSPLYEIALIALFNWLMARKDWGAFVEIFGLPNGVVIMPPDIRSGKEQEYQNSAERVAEGVSGALPHGSDIKFPTAGLRGESPFEKYSEAQEKDVVLAGTSGELTMISRPTGIGKGASQEHNDAWQRIALQKARRVNETLQSDFDIPELAQKFPNQPVCVYFELAVRDMEDVGTFLDNCVKADGIGLQVDEKEASERAGIAFTRVQQPAPALGGDPAQTADGRIDRSAFNASVRNRSLRTATMQGAATKTDVENFAAAVSGDVAPVLARLAAISEIKDDGIFEQKLKAFYADFPQLQNDVLKDPRSDRALLPIITKALLAGLKNNPVKNRVVKNGGDGSGDFDHIGREGQVGGSGPGIIRETRVPAHPALVAKLGIHPRRIFADYHALQQKHPEIFHTDQEAKDYVEHVVSHPTHVFPGNVPNHAMVVRRDEENKSVALDVEERGGKYRVRSAHTLTEDQFQQKLKTAGPDATLGISRVNPKNRASETPSRSLDASHDAPPAVI